MEPDGGAWFVHPWTGTGCGRYGVEASVRVAFWGALAMGLTAVVGRLFGPVV